MIHGTAGYAVGRNDDTTSLFKKHPEFSQKKTVVQAKSIDESIDEEERDVIIEDNHDSIVGQQSA